MTQLATNRFHLNEFVSYTFKVYPEAGTPFEALLDRNYWAHVSAKMKPFCEIIAIPDDRTFYARFLVLDCGRLFADVFLLEHTPIVVQPKEEAAAEYKVHYAGPHAKWRVVRLADKSVVADKFETRGPADEWLTNHLKAMAA